MNDALPVGCIFLKWLFPLFCCICVRVCCLNGNQSLVHCRSEQSQQRIGIELLEASVADLNPYELRKTHQFGNFKYDPGKYYSRKNTRGSASNAKDGHHHLDDDRGLVDPDQAEEEEARDNATFEDEMEAPWNQYAWAEELKLRVRGSKDQDTCE